MSDIPRRLIALHVEKAIPSLALIPGDVVMVEYPVLPGESVISFWRIGPQNPTALAAVAQSLMVWLDKGVLTPQEGEAHTVYSLLSSLAAGQNTFLRLVTDTEPSGLAALLNLHRTTTPLQHEANGAELRYWQIRRELDERPKWDDDSEDAGEEWKNGGEK